MHWFILDQGNPLAVIFPSIPYFKLTQEVTRVLPYFTAFLDLLSRLLPLNLYQSIHQNTQIPPQPTHRSERLQKITNGNLLHLQHGRNTTTLVQQVPHQSHLLPSG